MEVSLIIYLKKKRCAVRVTTIERKGKCFPNLRKLEILSYFPNEIEMKNQNLKNFPDPKIKIKVLNKKFYVNNLKHLNNFYYN